ncbi:MAG: type II toxin-antitoxin system HicA family toxin [Elusimicrobia bacterium]|nr:type II toxin-antitoxin system HicA family toxin [Elusimicrobiota bacterium]
MLNPVSRRELIAKLREFGFTGPFGGGKHSFMVKGTLKLRIPNPHAKDIGVPLLRELLRQAGIVPTAWQ